MSREERLRRKREKQERARVDDAVNRLVGETSIYERLLQLASGDSLDKIGGNAGFGRKVGETDNAFRDRIKDHLKGL